MFKFLAILVISTFIVETYLGKMSIFEIALILMLGCVIGQLDEVKHHIKNLEAEVDEYNEEDKK